MPKIKQNSQQLQHSLIEKSQRSSYSAADQQLETQTRGLLQKIETLSQDPHTKSQQSLPAIREIHETLQQSAQPLLEQKAQRSLYLKEHDPWLQERGFRSERELETNSLGQAQSQTKLAMAL